MLAVAIDATAVRLCYAWPTDAYLGLKSYADELEPELVLDGVSYDVVAFEALKVARLVLKGHPPTLDWIVGEEPLIAGEHAPELVRLASERRARLEAGAGVALEASDYDALDAWVRRVRQA